MATLRLQFPEKDKSSVIVLRGRRITVGRSPNNTIQIMDRTLSGRHAELIEEDGHYRVHDASSSNGVFVNGNLVSDFHLREACQLTFGSVQCEFDPAGQSAENEDDLLPTQADLTMLREQNADLTSKLTILQEELSSLHLLRPSDAADAGLVIAQAAHEKVAMDLAGLKEDQLKTQQQISRLNEELAITRRDNDNLQRALDVLKAALDKASPFSASTGASAAMMARSVPSKPAPDSTAKIAEAITPAPSAPSSIPVAKAPEVKPAAVVAAPTPAIPAAPKPGIPAPAAVTPAAPRPTSPAPGVPMAPKAAIPSAPALVPKPVAPVAPAPTAATPPLAKPPGLPSAPIAKPPGTPVAASAVKPSLPTAPMARPPGAPSLPSAPKATVPGLASPRPAAPAPSPVGAPKATGIPSAPGINLPKPPSIAPKAGGPPGMVASGSKPPGVVTPSAGLPKPTLKPGLPMAPKAAGDGTKTQKIQS